MLKCIPGRIRHMTLVSRIKFATRAAPAEKETLLVRGKLKYDKASTTPSSTAKALAHFDELYPQVYGDDLWASVRLALLSPRKYVALMNTHKNDSILHQEEMQRKGCRRLCEAWRRALDECQTRKAAEQAGGSKEIVPEVSRNPPPELPVVSQQNVASDRSNLNEFVPVKEVVTEQNVVVGRPQEQVWQDIHEGPASLLLPPGMKTIRPQSAHTMDLNNIPSGVQWHVDTETRVPELWRLLASPRGSSQGLGKPMADETQQFDFYPLDGASLLPVLALNLQANDRLLDMCAGPGGKTTAALLTGLPEYVLCVDASMSRLERVLHTVNTHCGNRLWEVRFLKKMQEKGPPKESTEESRGVVELLCANASTLANAGPHLTTNFNKILVDVPCSSDRHVVTDPESNLFDEGRMKERLGLQERQKALLRTALLLVSVGGDVVYSTCTMSTAQNATVVRETLQELSEKEPNLKFSIADMWHWCSPDALGKWFRIWEFTGPQPSVGLTALPDVCENYGPSYFCKIRKLSD